MQAQSYYTFAEGVRNEDGLLWLYPGDPYTYRQLDDTIEHTVADGDTPWSIAATYYADLPNSAELYKVICDFQPEPIIDPTIRLDAGSVVYVPSQRVLVEEIFSETRRYAVSE